MRAGLWFSCLPFVLVIAGAGGSRDGEQPSPGSSLFSVGLDAPRFMREGDRFWLPVTLTNRTSTAVTFWVRHRLRGLQMLSRPQVALPVGSFSSRRYQLYVRAMGRQRVGQVKIHLSTVKGSHTARFRWPILPRGVLYQSHKAAQLRGTTFKLAWVVPKDADPKSLRLRLRGDFGRLRAIEGALGYLVRYPHGCMEQTLSRFLPLLAVERVARRLKLKRSGLLRQTSALVKAGIRRLEGRQCRDGSWVWWRRCGDFAPKRFSRTRRIWLTAYILYGLVHAKEAGYRVSVKSLYRTRARLLKLLAKNAASETGWVGPAIGLAALALAKVDIRAYLRLAMGSILKSGAAHSQAWLLLAALHARDRAAAKQIGASLLKLSKADKLHARWGREAEGLRHGRIETTATALRALLMWKPKHALIPLARRWLLEQRRSQRWGSTRDTAAAVLALAAHHDSLGSTTGKASYLEASLNGTFIGKWTVYPNRGKPSQLVYRGTQLRRGRNQLVVKLTHGPQVYLQGTLGYRSVHGRIGSAARLSVDHRLSPLLKLSHRWNRRSKGKKYQWVLSKLRLRVLRRTASHIMLEVPLPAGYRRAGIRPPIVRSVGSRYRSFRGCISRAKARPDVLLYFCRHLPPGRWELRQVLKTRFASVATAPPVRVSLVYSPSVRSVGRSRLLVSNP